MSLRFVAALELYLSAFILIEIIPSFLDAISSDVL